MGSFNKLALCCALLMQGAVLASEYIDVLDLPAKPSALARHSPGGWDVARQWGFPSPAQVVDRGLYPERPKERVFFWLNLTFGLLGSTLWLYLPFGVLAYSLRAGG